ncbi:MAG: hypothetical protein QXP58_06945 [Thermoprotei archaeon]
MSNAVMTLTSVLDFSGTISIGTITGSGGTPTPVVLGLNNPRAFGVVKPNIVVILGGAFQTGEVATVTVTATYDNNQAATVAATFTAVGTYSFSAAQNNLLMSTDRSVTRFAATAQSSSVSSSVTATVNVTGLELVYGLPN